MNPILVIDDEEMYRSMISSVLRQSGYTVLEAGDGEKGLEIVQNQPVELIISDVMMDNLDGFGFIERVRMDPANATIPFIFVTGLSDKQTMRKGMSLGADDFLVKPFTGDELLAAVDSRLSKRKENTDEAERKLSQLRSSIRLAMPHEIRTPLASIIGFAEIIRDDGDKLSGTEIVECGKLLYKSGKRLQRLLENFVMFTQIEVIGADEEKLAFLKSSQLQETAMLIRCTSRKKAEQNWRVDDLELDLSESQVAVSGMHFEKIFDELVDNAFKFSPAGSKVSVTTSVKGDDFVLKVKDRGRGMTADQITNLGAYVQFDRPAYEQQGSGLGLTIAKRLVELYGGRMEFENTSGQGLSVEVHLPVAGSQ
ncbi:MAG: hybrid sensor histidine kinase/response regulator [Ignavibacteriales bacterium]|nr:hybrid sensor histidine kinase/response regulator [Ignavibacteriales bacterium]